MSVGRRAPSPHRARTVAWAGDALSPHPARSGRRGRRAGRKGGCMSELEVVVVGIDVAKAWLDIAVRPSGEQRRLDNDTAGIATTVAWLRMVGPHLIVVEATGGYEAPLV